MTKKLAIAGAIALVSISLAGCSETLKEWFGRVAPIVACKKAEREHNDWIAAGKPIERGGEAEKAAARKVIEVAYGKVKSECANRGVIIN